MPSIMPLGATMSAPGRGVASPRPGRGSRAWRRCPPFRREGRRSGRGWCTRSSRRPSRAGDPGRARATGAGPAGRCRPPRSSPSPTSSFSAGSPNRITAGNAERPDPIGLAIERLVHREMTDARHRGDLALDPAAVHHENGLDEIAGGQLVLPHQAAHGLGAPPAAGTFHGGGNHDGRLGSAGTHRNHAKAGWGTWHAGCRVLR